MKVLKFPFTLTKAMLPELFEGMSMEDILKLSVKYPTYIRYIINDIPGMFIKTKSEFNEIGLFKELPVANINKVFGIEPPRYKQGELLFVRNNEEDEWQLRYFSHIHTSGLVCCYDFQRKQGDSSSWKYHQKTPKGFKLPS